MKRKLYRHSPAVANTVFDARRERQVNAIARSQFAAGLRDSDDGPAGLKLFPGDSPSQVAVDVNGCFARIGRVVEPDFAAQFFLRCIAQIDPLDLLYMGRSLNRAEPGLRR